MSSDGDSSATDLDDQFDDDSVDMTVQQAIDLGTFTIDELEAMCPGRVDLLAGADPVLAAGARSLLARGMFELAEPDGGGPVETVSDQATTVAASFLGEPQRTILFRREDLFGTDEFALYGRMIDDELCYVVEGGTSGLRRLLFVTADNIATVIQSVVGLADVDERTDHGEPVVTEFDLDDADVDSPLSKALEAPLHLVTATASAADGVLTEFSFVHGDEQAWICEWTGDTTMRVRSLDEATVALTMARILT